ALRGSGEKDLGGRRVAVLLEEVVLDLPDAVEAQLVHQLDLFEGVLQELVLGLRSPRPGQLVLVEHAELHDGSLLTEWRRWRRRRRRRTGGTAPAGREPGGRRGPGAGCARAGRGRLAPARAGGAARAGAGGRR